MLQYARANILNQIESSTKAIDKDANKIKWLKIHLKEEPNGVRKWLYKLEIQHAEASLETKKNQLKDLFFNLQVTDAAIASQERDSQLIETNSLNWKSLLEKTLASQSDEIDGDTPAVAFANTLFNLVSKTGIFKTIKREEDCSNSTKKSETAS